MAKKSIIDDVKLDDAFLGNPILFTNQLIRKMLTLADANKDDIFYDLGSGWGQNLIIALTEFSVKKAIGIENSKDRNDKANKRLKRLMKARPEFKDRGFSILADFEKDLFKNKIEDANLNEATILFYGLSNTSKFLDDITKHLRKGARFVYYFNWIFPEIVANQSEYPFFMSIYPFKKPRSELEWLKSIVKKDKSTINPGEEPSARELWDELVHDFDVEENRWEAKSYQARLKRLLKAKR